MVQLNRGLHAKPCLLPHKLSFWPLYGAVLTGGLLSAVSLIQCSNECNFCLIWSQLVSLIVSAHVLLLTLKVLFRINQSFTPSFQLVRKTWQPLFRFLHMEYYLSRSDWLEVLWVLGRPEPSQIPHLPLLIDLDLKLQCISQLVILHIQKKQTTTSSVQSQYFPSSAHSHGDVKR